MNRKMGCRASEKPDTHKSRIQDNRRFFIQLLPTNIQKKYIYSLQNTLLSLKHELINNAAYSICIFSRTGNKKKDLLANVKQDHPAYSATYPAFSDIRLQSEIKTYPLYCRYQKVISSIWPQIQKWPDNRYIPDTETKSHNLKRLN